MKDSLEEVLLGKLQKRAQTLSTAESCTGGLVAHRLTNVSGASAVFKQGFVTYCNTSKVKLLNVPSALLERHGPVSKEVAMAMAEGVRAVSNTTFGLATTGVAGPTGGTDETPVGTLFLAIAEEGKKTLVWHAFFPGEERLAFKEKAAELLLEQLVALLSK